MESLLRDFQLSNQIVFVCSGNIIRSAFAEIYTKHLIGWRSNKSIRSLGTDYHNSQILDMTRNTLIDKGIDSQKINNFQPTHISGFKVENIDDVIFFSMTNHHKTQLQRYFGKGIKSYLLPKILDENVEIEDPYFTNNYEQVFLKIEKCVNQLVNYYIN